MGQFGRVVRCRASLYADFLRFPRGVGQVVPLAAHAVAYRPGSVIWSVRKRLAGSPLERATEHETPGTLPRTRAKWALGVNVENNR